MTPTLKPNKEAPAGPVLTGSRHCERRTEGIKKEGMNTGRNWAVDGINGLNALNADKYSNPSKCNGKFLRKHCMHR